MWSVDMQHFLDEKGSTDMVPPAVKEMADHFGAIVAAVTLDFTGLAIEVLKATFGPIAPADFAVCAIAVGAASRSTGRASVAVAQTEPCLAGVASEA